ncbi:unnamed protein product [Urochloa humidicola]
MIEDARFGGLLKIGCATIPAEFANWLLVDCFDAETSQLVLPGRGSISLTADSVNQILGLPNSDAEVKYELDVEAINFMHENYGLDQGTAPKIDAIVKRIVDNNEANDDFLRSFPMLAVSTFLCPPTSLGISPRCYPSLVDLSSVKDLNWSQFVVDQFKLCATKMEKKDSVRVCLLLLVVLYVDSLDAGNLQIPSCKPRVAAWSRKLIEEVIKLDTNRDGSFGKLKLKKSAYSTVHDTFFGSNDIEGFVSAKAPRGISMQKKRRISAAVTRVLSGMTDLLGTFVQEICAVDSEQESEPEPSNMRSEAQPSKRRSEAQPRKRSEEGPSNRRSKRQRNAEHGKKATTNEDIAYATSYEETALDSDYEEEDEYEDYSTPDDSQDTDKDEVEEMSSSGDESTRHGGPDTRTDLPRSGQTNEDMHLHTIAEADEEDMEGVHEHGADRNQSNKEMDDEDHEPLAARMRRMKEAINRSSKGQEPESDFDPIPLEVCPPPAPPAAPAAAAQPAAPAAAQPAVQNKDMFKNRRARLRLPEVVEGCSPAPSKRTDILDFTPPECDPMKFIDSSQQHHPGQAASSPSVPHLNGNLGQNSDAGAASICPLDFLDEDMLTKIEEEAIKEINARKLNSLADTSKTPPVCVAGTSNNPIVPDQDQGSGNSSATPAYQPPPRRQARKAAALRSPFLDIQAINLFKCNKAVNDVYNAVLAMDSKRPSARSRSTKSNQSDVIIINYWDFHITLSELARSVKPGATLENVVAEIGLYVINPKGKKATKRVLPLRTSDHLQSGQLDRPAIRQVFRKGTNHLDHRQMVMFPVLQIIEGKDSEKVGHYFLLVLNLRNGRFEVLDSMRTLRDGNLKACCNKIIAAIKSLWRMHYPGSRFDTGSYELVPIAVPLQNNNHDCGFHMLMHAEHWDGSTVYNFQEKDIANIRKLLTYKWLTNEENDSDWKQKLGLA